MPGRGVFSGVKSVWSIGTVRKQRAMTTFTSDAGLNRAIETALGEHPFAGLVGAGAPLLVSDRSQILWCNEAARALFGADEAALARRLFQGADPASRRLAELAGSLVPGAAPRLEKLRFIAGLRVETLTVLCRRTLGPQSLFILGVPTPAAPKRSGPALAPFAAPVEQPSPFVQPAPVVPAPPIAPVQIVAAPIVTKKAAPPVERKPLPAGPRRSAIEVAADLAGRLHGTDQVRFLWQTDADHCFVKITGELCDLVGCITTGLIGRSFVDLADELALDVDGRLHEALQRGDTWSGIEILWPVENADAAFPVTLGALPSYDRERRFEGYRGFGVIHVTRLQETEPTALAQGIAPAPLPDAPLATPDVEEENIVSGVPDNVVALRPFQVVPRRAVEEEETPAAQEPSKPAPDLPSDDDMVSLSPGERHAFREIARALGARVRDDKDEVRKPAAPASVRDLIEVATRMSEQAERPPVDVMHEIVPQAEPVALAQFPEPVQAVLDRLPIGVLVARDSFALFANRTLLDLLGYADAPQFLREDGFARMFRGRSNQWQSDDTGSVQILTRDGSALPLDVRIQKIEWDGAPASLMTFRRAETHDLPQRLRALEAELRTSEAGMRELHAILDTATDGVAVLDEEGRIVALNRAGEALFGYEQSDVAGDSFSVLFARESQGVALDYFAGIKASGVASVLNDGREVMGRAHQGGSIQLFMTLGRIGSNGTPKFCAVLRDMTAWKKAERELKDARRTAEQANATKSDFLAKISHEIRTPLNAILGFAEVMIEERFGPVGNERYKDYLKDIHASGSHVMSLVNDLLDLSKIEAGKLELNFGAVDANKIVAECVSLIQPQAARERVIVRQSLAPRLPMIVADERALRQIVLNLLSNAVKFNEAGGQVIVSTALTDAGHAVIRIRDTGIGMSESEIEMALEPFRQLVTASRTRGTGLGLPLTKALVEANRASFTIKSKKAEGTLVEVAFPPTRVLAE